MAHKVTELEGVPIGDGVVPGGSGNPGVCGVAHTRVMHSFSEPTMFTAERLWKQKRALGVEKLDRAWQSLRNED